MLTRTASLSIVSILFIALCFMLAPAIGLAAPLAQTGQVYLPLINGGGNTQLGTPTPVTPTPVTPTATSITPTPVTPTPTTPAPALPYDTLLTQASARCQHTAVNQACLVNGTAAGFAQIGDTLALTQGMTLTVQSQQADVDSWSIVLLRLQAPGDATITQTLDLIAVGNVEVAVQHLFTSTEVAPGVPVVRFVSQPVQSGNQRAPSGLILENRTESELLSVEVNGAGITLDGIAFLLTKPISEIQSADTLQTVNEMIVNVRQGSAMVQAVEESSMVATGEQVKVALNVQGTASAAPSQPVESDDDLLVPLVPPEWDTFSYLSRYFFRVQMQCRLAHNPRRVYQLFYYARQLNTPKMRAFISQDEWEFYLTQIKECARFEMIFDSTIIGSTSLTWRDHVHSDGTFIQFDINGDLVAEASSPLKHLQVEMSAPACTLQSISSPDGTFAVNAASLRIHYNTMKIAMQTFPYMTLEQIPTGHFICPAPAPPLNIPIEWNTMFIQLHPELWLPQPIYLLQEEHWKYTGRQIFAEAIFADRSAPFADGMIESDSYFILRHAPVE